MIAPLLKVSLPLAMVLSLTLMNVLLILVVLTLSVLIPKDLSHANVILEILVMDLLALISMNACNHHAWPMLFVPTRMVALTVRIRVVLWLMAMNASTSTNAIQKINALRMPHAQIPVVHISVLDSG